MSGTHKPFNTKLIRDAIEVISKDRPIGKISFFESIDSTNAWLLENGACGDVCLSEAQSAGRGRRDNKWVSPNSGNIYFSLCACLDDSIQHRSLLGLVAGIAIVEALENIGLSGHSIKWPNDIFWQRKKLGGVLIQTSSQSEKYIIGVGLNISLPEESLKKITQAAVSLDEAMPGPYSRDQLIIQLIQRITLHLDNFKCMAFDDFLQNWEKWDILRGEKVNFQHQDSLISGIVEGLDQHGRLAISMADGVLEYYSSADIKLSKR